MGGLRSFCSTNGFITASLIWFHSLWFCIASCIIPILGRKRLKGPIYTELGSGEVGLWIQLLLDVNPFSFSSQGPSGGVWRWEWSHGQWWWDHPEQRLSALDPIRHFERLCALKEEDKDKQLTFPPFSHPAVKLPSILSLCIKVLTGSRALSAYVLGFHYVHPTPHWWENSRGSWGLILQTSGPPPRHCMERRSSFYHVWK